jgi:hypothetical protein
MGCDTNVACKTCKTNFYCGYGGYGSFDKRMENLKGHEDHDTYAWSSDWTFEKDGHLYFCNGGFYDDDIVIENFKDYKNIDLTEPL